MCLASLCVSIFPPEQSRLQCIEGANSAVRERAITVFEFSVLEKELMAAICFYQGGGTGLKLRIEVAYWTLLMDCLICKSYLLRVLPDKAEAVTMSPCLCSTHRALKASECATRNARAAIRK